jgi:hypothetical protein
VEVGSREDAIKTALMIRACPAEPIAGDAQPGMGEKHFGDCPLAKKPAPAPSTAVRVHHQKCVLAGAILATL